VDPQVDVLEHRLVVAAREIATLEDGFAHGDLTAAVIVSNAASNAMIQNTAATTARVAALPTPLASRRARSPRRAPENPMIHANATLLMRPRTKSIALSRSIARTQNDTGESRSDTSATIIPPTIPTNIAISVSTGNTIVSAVRRGTTRNRVGLTPIACSTS